MSIFSDSAAQERAMRWVAARDELNEASDQWVREAVGHGVDPRDARRMAGEANYAGWNSLDETAAEWDREHAVLELKHLLETTAPAAHADAERP